jgi:hypothetical protein
MSWLCTNSIAVFRNCGMTWAKMATVHTMFNGIYI